MAANFTQWLFSIVSTVVRKFQKESVWAMFIFFIIVFYRFFITVSFYS